VTVEPLRIIIVSVRLLILTIGTRHTHLGFDDKGIVLSILIVECRRVCFVESFCYMRSIAALFCVFVSCSFCWHLDTPQSNDWALSNSGLLGSVVML